MPHRDPTCALRVPRRGSVPAARRAMTLVELLIVVSIMAVVVSVFTSMVVSTTRERAINNERAAAANAARVVVEEMRNESFAELFALYNADPADDPDGPGTAPGNRFAVGGLSPLEEAEDDTVGQVFFPVIAVGGVEELREDVHAEQLGTPRDLDGDSIVDDADHANDYILLPVHVRVEWSGRVGKSHYDLYTLLAELGP